MYPARWFPVSGYTTDRFAADMNITVPTGYTVLGSGLDSHQTAGDKNVYEFKFERPSFPGSIAVVKEQPAKVQSEGVTTSLYFRGAGGGRMAQPYGEEIGKIDVLLHGHVRAAAVRQPDGGGDRRRRAQRLCRARADLPRAARHRPDGEPNAAGQPGFAAVVGRAGFAGHAQPPVADQRTGRLLGAAVDGARQRRGRHGNAAPRRDGGRR